MIDERDVLYVDDDPVLVEFVDSTEVVDDPSEVTDSTEVATGPTHRTFTDLDVLWAADAQTALDTLDSETVGCVLCSSRLSDVEGIDSDVGTIDLLSRVHKRFPDLPVVILLDDTDPKAAANAIAAGATDYIPRAVAEDYPELLANRLRNVLRTLEGTPCPHGRGESHRHSNVWTDGYQALINAAPIPILVVDRKYQVRYVNDSGVDALGANSTEDIVETSIERFIPDTETSTSRERLASVLFDGEPVEVVEYEFIDCDGNTHMGQGAIIPVTFEGEPAAQVVTADITDRRVTEARLQRQREQIAKLHDVGVELASCENQRDVYELMVDAAENILDLDLCIVDSVTDGYLTVEATSSELTEYEEAPVEDGGLAGRAYETGNSYLIGDSHEHPEADPVGEYRSTITVPIEEYGVFQAAAYEPDAFDEQDLELVEILAGHVRESLIRLEQEEKLRDQHERLQRENERLDQFASIISHDLRNPLNVATLRLNLAMEETETEHLEPVARSLERMETLIDELLTLARMGKEITELEAVRLETVVEHGWRNVETGEAVLSTSAKGVLLADRSRLQQLLENLFRNAVEHGSTNPHSNSCEDAVEHASTSPRSSAHEDAVEHSGDSLTVTVGILEGKDGFYVADDGVGIPPDLREEVLEFGYSSEKGGTGLGLAIVGRVAEAHGWEVTVTESEDGGARFDFIGVTFTE